MLDSWELVTGHRDRLRRRSTGKIWRLHSRFYLALVESLDCAYLVHDDFPEGVELWL